LIWILAALESELVLLKKRLDAVFQGDIGGYPHYLGKTGNERIRLGVTGIGISSACLSIGSFIGFDMPETAIMVGTAGAMPDSGLKVGDTVIASTELLAEFGIAKETGIGDVRPLKLESLRQAIDFSESLVRDISRATGEKEAIYLGKMLTVVGVSPGNDEAHRRAQYFQTLAENMEGYGLALAGLRFGINAAEIRGISNMAGDNNKANWDFKGAREKAQMVLLEYLTRES
jgi:futalosine hydrolase